MKLLDKYILKKLLTTFLFTVIIFVVVICVIDFTENNDDFISEKIPYSEIFGVYYLNYIPYLANMLSPILIFIATVVVTAQLAARTEIIAMFNSGMSFIRVLVPYIIGSLLIGGLTFFLIGWIIPHATKKRAEFETKYLKGQFYFEGQNVHMKIAPNVYMYVKNYNNITQTGFDFTLETIKDNKLLSKLKATQIKWDSVKNKWSIREYSLRTFKNGQETLVRGVNIDTTINIYPSDFEETKRLYATFDNQELNARIARLKERGSEEVAAYLTEKYERYTYPFAILILTVIAVIVSARKSRQGTGFQIAFGFALAMIYILFVIMSRSVAHLGDIDPLVGAWVPNILFSFIGFIMYKTLPR